jgi:hypothetical protein
VTAFPRVLLAERLCKGCGCMFVRAPDEPGRPYDRERCGVCIAALIPEEKKAA